MKFLLSLYPGAGTGHEEFLAMAGRTGELIGGHELADPSLALVVRVRDGVPAVTEGPYDESAEHVARHYLVDCESRDRAVELAGLLRGRVEVRPLMEPVGLEM